MYGFVFYLLSSAALAAYLVWLLLPQEYLEATGLAEIFPQKYWAVAVPIYLGVSCAKMLIKFGKIVGNSHATLVHH